MFAYRIIAYINLGNQTAPTENIPWHVLTYSDSRSILVSIIRSSVLSGTTPQPGSELLVRAKPKIQQSSEQKESSECQMPEKETCEHSHSGSESTKIQTRFDGKLDSITNNQVFT